MAIAAHRRRGAARRLWAPLVALALCCTLGVGTATGRANQPRAASTTATVFALLADNRLLAVRLATGAVVALCASAVALVGGITKMVGGITKIGSP